jgi:tripartite-type tricarboxylate transporter receptor subunit TctC
MAAVEKSYPNKPITVIVPFSIGGGTDLIARELEKHALKYFGQPLVIINRPGGGGTIGWNELADSTPDGYVIGITGIEILLHPLYSQTKYHYPSALEPIGQISSTPIVLAVLDDQPWKTLSELLTYAKDHPGVLKFAHGGLGSNPHIVGEMLGKAANVNIKQVPFRGAADGTAALLGNHVHFIITNPAVLKEHIKSSNIRVLAVSSSQRLSDPLLRSIPTFREQGFDIVSTPWFGIGAPKNLPPDIKDKLETGFKKIINDPEFKKDLETIGFPVDYLDSQEFSQKWQSENQKLSKEVQETSIVELIQSQKK